MRPRISIRGFDRPSVGPSVGPSRDFLNGGKRANNEWLTNLRTQPYQQTPPHHHNRHHHHHHYPKLHHHCHRAICADVRIHRYHQSHSLITYLYICACNHHHHHELMSYMDASLVACRPCFLPPHYLMSQSVFSLNNLISINGDVSESENKILNWIE